jgi:DNA-binding transcriptional LysR family regulator
VTQGAVSHQVKALEAELGIESLDSRTASSGITEAGRQYLAVIRDALDRIALGTERLQQRQNSGALTVSTSPDFAAKWLVHRDWPLLRCLSRYRSQDIGEPASRRFRAGSLSSTSIPLLLIVSPKATAGLPNPGRSGG